MTLAFSLFDSRVCLNKGIELNLKRNQKSNRQKFEREHFLNFFLKNYHDLFEQGRIWGGGGGGLGLRTFFLSGFRLPAGPKTDPKIFLRAPSAPIYTNFKGGTNAKKTQFFGQPFTKNFLKLPFLACFFFKFLPVAQKLWSEWGLYSDLGELRKSIWST